jgi:hypothetical protein
MDFAPNFYAQEMALFNESELIIRTLQFGREIEGSRQFTSYFYKISMR